MSTPSQKNAQNTNAGSATNIRSFLSTLKPSIEFVLNVTTGFMLIFLWWNFLWNPWPLSWNPIDWLFFVRTGGPLLYGNHISASVAILTAISYFTIRHPSKAFQWAFVVMSTVSIHELLVMVSNVSVYLSNALGLVSPKYAADMLAILIPGLIAASKEQRKMLMEIALLMATVETAWTMGILAFHFPTNTVVFNPGGWWEAGPAFLSWPENVLEVVSWVMPSSWWILRWRTR